MDNFQSEIFTISNTMPILFLYHIYISKLVILSLNYLLTTCIYIFVNVHYYYTHTFIVL